MAWKPGNRALNTASVEQGRISRNQQDDTAQGKMNRVKAPLLDKRSPMMCRVIVTVRQQCAAPSLHHAQAF